MDVSTTELRMGTGEGARQVILLLEGREYLLSGHWTWPLHSDTVYCSDVLLSLPPHYEGTRGLLHPDDLPLLHDFVTDPEAHDFALRFRILGSRPAPVELSGQRLMLQPADALTAIPEQERTDALRLQELHRDLAALQRRRKAYDALEKEAAGGSWWYCPATGEVGYSDGIYRIFNLPPQSLNPHLHTFAPFLHPDDESIVLHTLREVLRNEYPLELQYRVLVGTSTRVLRLTLRWQYEDRGAALAIGTLRDVTTQERTEGDLHRSEAALAVAAQAQRLLEVASGAGHWLYYPRSKRLTVSDTALRLQGIRPGGGAITFDTLLKTAHPDDRDALAQAYHSAREGGSIPELEYRVLRADGKVRVLRLRGRVLQESAGGPVLAAIVEDITVLRGHQHRLDVLTREQQEREAMTQLADEHSSGASWLQWEGGRDRWSEGLFALLGLRAAPASFRQADLEALLTATDRAAFALAVQALWQDGQDVRLHLQLQRQGELVPLRVELRLRTIGNQRCLLGHFIDDRAARQLAQNLRNGEGLLQLLTDHLPMQVLVTDSSHNVLYWSRKAEQVNKVRPESALHRHLLDVLPDLEGMDIIANLDRALAGERVELEAVPVPGDRNTLRSLHLLPLRLDGAISAVLHVVTDVTRTYEQEQQLAERLHLVETLVHASQDRIIVLDRHMNYLYCNERAASFYGLEPKDLLGRNVLEVFPQTLHTPAFEHFRRALHGETVILPLPATNGDTPVLRLLPVRGGDGPVVAIVWIYRDRE